MRNWWWKKYYEPVRSISQLGMTESEFDEFCLDIEYACDNYGVNYMGLYIAKPQYIDSLSERNLDVLILTDHKDMPVVTISGGDVVKLIPVEESEVYVDNDDDAIQRVAVDIFNRLADDYYKELMDHTDRSRELIRNQIYTEHSEYNFSPTEIEEIITCVEDIADDYYSAVSDYYGAASARKYGDKISSLYNGQIISKRIDDTNSNGPKVVGLKTAARAVGTQIHQILNALEGMCYEDRACEIDDSHYFIGSYEDWEEVEARL